MIKPNKCQFCSADPILHSDIINIATRNIYYICPGCGITSCKVSTGQIFTKWNINKIPETTIEQVTNLWNMIRKVNK